MFQDCLRTLTSNQLIAGLEYSTLNLKSATMMRQEHWIAQGQPKTRLRKN